MTLEPDQITNQDWNFAAPPDAAELSADIAEFLDANPAYRLRTYWPKLAELINANLRERGEAEWPPETVRQLWAKRIRDRKQAERDERADRRDGVTKGGRNRDGKGGPTPDARVKRIRDALDCHPRRAYTIAALGTAVFDQRKALAAAFRGDPAWDYPAAWELKSGKVSRGRPNPKTLRAFALAMGTDFDGELDEPLATLRAAFIRGTLPDQIKDLGALIAALDSERIDLDALTAVNVWNAFQRWRGSN